MEHLILIGGGGHAISCIDVIESTRKYKIKGIVESDNNENSFSSFAPVIGTDKDLPRLFQDTNIAFNALGQIKSAIPRIQIFNRLKRLKVELPFIISPHAYLSKRSYVGDGTILMHHSFVNANVSIGENCIINTKASIEHDVVIEDHCHISTGALVNGNVRVGQGSFIGSGAIIKQGVKIGKNVVIGAGRLILNDVLDNAVVK